MPRWTQTVLYCSRLGELASRRPEPRQNTTHDDFCKNVTEIVALFENATAPAALLGEKKLSALTKNGIFLHFS